MDIRCFQNNRFALYECFLKTVRQCLKDYLQNKHDSRSHKFVSFLDENSLSLC